MNPVLAAAIVALYVALVYKAAAVNARWLARRGRP